MMKTYYILFVSLLVLMLNTKANAQDFPWPEISKKVVIEPGAPGVINETINAATEATHFILKRGVAYIYTAEMKNAGFPIMVTAEDGDSDKPLILPLGPAPGASEATRPFLAQGNMYLKDLVMVGWDLDGNYTDNATVRFAADGITIVIKDCVFDFNRQNAIRINAKDCKLYVENSIFGNQGIAQRLFQGFPLTTRGNWVVEMVLRNNTFYNLHSMVLDNMAPLRYNKLVFESNTIVNTGTGGYNFGRPDSLIMKNNLHLNVGILGDGFVGDRSKFVMPHYYLGLDSNYVDKQLVDPFVEFSNNHFYLNPAVAELLPDSSQRSTLSLFHPYLNGLIGDNNVVKDENFIFTGFAAPVSEYQAYINDFYNFAADPAQMPLFNSEIATLNFAYPTDHAAYKAASDGGPVGDRNWFPNWVPTSSKFYNSKNVMLYPNPAKHTLNIAGIENISSLEVCNLQGQIVARNFITMNDQAQIDVSGLSKGMYILKITSGNSVTISKKFRKE